MGEPQRERLETHMPASILVGVDSSFPSRSALLWAIKRAVRVDCPIELVHVVDQSNPAAREAACELLRTELDFARARAPKLTLMTSIAEGAAEDALVRRSPGHSLLVVGTHKTGFIYGRSFGSRFLGLASRARSSVAFIPDQLGVARSLIVAPAETSPSGEAVVRFAAAEAAATGNELTLIAQSRDQAEAAATVVRSAHPDLAFRTRTTDLHLPEALVEASVNATLLVIGRPRRLDDASLVLANNHDVLLNMACPVIVVRA